MKHAEFIKNHEMNTLHARPTVKLEGGQLYENLRNWPADETCCLTSCRQSATDEQLRVSVLSRRYEISIGAAVCSLAGLVNVGGCVSLAGVVFCQ